MLLARLSNTWRSAGNEPCVLGNKNSADAQARRSGFKILEDSRLDGVADMGTRTSNGGAGGKSAKRISGKAASPSASKRNAPKSNVNDNGVDRILLNLADCMQTLDEEKRTYKELIESVMQRHGKNIVTAVSEIMKEVARRVGQEKHYFRGTASNFHKQCDVWHTKRSTYLEARLEKEISRTSHGSDYSASNDAKDIIAKLRSPGQWLNAAGSSGFLPIHEIGTPCWVADPTSGDPEPSVHKEYYPARAGIAPDQDGIYEYVLLPLRIPGPATYPRFADSGGYPFWRPGGRTEPISGCPDSFSGFEEAVTDQVTLACLVGEPQFFTRAH